MYLFDGNDTKNLIKIIEFFFFKYCHIIYIPDFFTEIHWKSMIRTDKTILIEWTPLTKI